MSSDLISERAWSTDLSLLEEGMSYDFSVSVPEDKTSEGLRVSGSGFRVTSVTKNFILNYLENREATGEDMDRLDVKYRPSAHNRGWDF